MTSGRLVPDELVQQLVVDRVAQDDCAGGCLLDGFPRTAPQAKMLDQLLADQGMAVDAAIKIEVDEDVLMERLAGRRRADDDAAIIRQRLKHYRQLTQPMEAYYEAAGRLRVVDGHGAPDEVFDRIVAELQAVDPAKRLPL
jgi:adenylate kinase